MSVASRRVLILPPFREHARRSLREIPETEVIEAPRVAGGPGSADALFAAASDAITRYGCTHVVATAERNMALAGRLRDAHGLTGLNWIQSLGVTDKRCMRLWAAPLVPMAAAWPSNEVLANPSVLDGVREVVVKPAIGAACRDVERLPVGAAMSRLRAAAGPWQVEEALDVDVELHCDGYFTDDGALTMVVSAYDRPLLVSIGTTQASFHLPPEHSLSQRAGQLMNTLLAGIPVSGAVFHAELLVVGERTLLGEIALRPASAGIPESLLLHHGVDIWGAFVRLQLGSSPPPVVPAPASWSGLAGVVSDEAGDLRWQERRLSGLAGVERVERAGVRWSDRPGTSSAFMWHIYFRAVSEAEARALLGRIAAVSAELRHQDEASQA
ncbi:hypothetical protein [Actinoplanes couchii]|uniref:ATP-grasp domain-containing protein n=1 Tax=Actinoplanes couchii TaxID=403638 RepID=A0ABQ3XSE3_9ACTN|nr:hypothetical protein [Actinoplanes couchii]MDR6315917.1 hypothetical protein [Actinoplanes couchii]GID61433.1 hypothetical protein Aco03nite_098370 [Actinoplanes couchii]